MFIIIKTIMRPWTTPNEVHYFSWPTNFYMLKIVTYVAPIFHCQPPSPFFFTTGRYKIVIELSGVQLGLKS